MKRWGYRVGEIVRLTGLARATVEREVKRLGIRQRHIGSAVLLEASATERAFGFGDPTPISVASPKVLERAARLLA